MYSAFMDHKEVLVMGGTGFVGKHLCRALIAAGCLPRLLVREGSEGRIPPDIRGRCRVTLGDAVEFESVENAAQGTTAIVNLVGIIREVPHRGITYDELHVKATRNAVRAARRWGIAPFVQMSALGARAGSPSGYFDSKGRAEEIVRNSELRWTIMRPSVIFGPGDLFIGRLAAMVKRSPLLPVPGDGRALLQPVYAGDVVRGFALALSGGGMAERSFDVGGPDRISFDEILDRIAESRGRRILKVHVPPSLVRSAVRLLGRFERFPLSMEQLDMLSADNVCDPSPFHAALGAAPVSLSDYLAGRAPAMRGGARDTGAAEGTGTEPGRPPLGAASVREGIDSGGERAKGSEPPARRAA